MRSICGPYTVPMAYAVPIWPGPYAVDGTRPIYRSISIMDTYGFIVDAMGPSRTLLVYHGQYGYIVDAMDPSWTPGVHHGHYESVHHGRYRFTMDTRSIMDAMAYGPVHQ
jgi:hypothetical protein